jgi:hypothetical protein
VLEKITNEVASYRTCFSTDAGRRVLADILINAGYFDTDLTTAGEIAVQNFVKQIVKKLGVGDTPQKVNEYVNNLFNLKVS